MSLATDASLDLAEAPFSKVCLPRFATHAALALTLTVHVLLNGSRLLGDPDTQWHITVGRWIVAHGSVPTTDLFSYTYAGAPWIAKEWISQLILFFAYEAAGWRGETILTAVVVAATFTGLYAWLAGRMRLTAALALTIGAFALSEIHLLARPHMLVMPVIVAWMIAVVGSLDRRTAPPLAAALLMVAWANMHGSFPFGLVMAGVLAGEGVLMAPAGTRLVALRRWGIFLATASAATMLSPFGWRAILVPLMMFGNNGTLRFISEWQPLGFDTLGAVAGYMLVVTGAILCLDARRNVFRILAAGLVAYLMVRHIRFVSLFGLISPILAARTVATFLPAGTPMLRVQPGARTAIMAGLSALAITAVTIAFVRRPEPSAEVTPRLAYEAALAHGVRGNVYNDYDFGGFLIAHDVKTFIDGRTDQLFLGDFLPDLKKAIDEKDDAAFAAIVTRSNAGWALIRPHSKTSAHFDRMPGWSHLFEDEHSAAYARD